MVKLDMQRIFPVKLSRNADLKELKEASRIADESRDCYIRELLKAGEEEAAAEIISLSYDNSSLFSATSKQALKRYFRDFKNQNILFDLIVSVYIKDGYNFPKSVIIKAKSIAKSIPEEKRLAGLPEGDVITIWRGTYVANPKAEEYVRRSISWTTDKNTAIWFANRISNSWTENGKGALWEGTIDRNKIITFTQDRNESEVIQYNSVQNLRIIKYTDEDVAAALYEHEKSHEKQRHKIEE